MVVVLGNSNMKETVVDTILKMEESHQTTLMNIMLKYITNENDRKKYLTYEYELIESLQQQLKVKETDRASAVEYLSKLEIENNNLVSKLNAVQKENKNLVNENEELHKELIKNIKIPNALVDIHKHREEELNNEVCCLNSKLDEVEKECQTKTRKLEEEKRRLQDELFIANQKALRLPTLENSLAQQKARTDKLLLALEERKKIDKRMELYAVKLQELEKEKDSIVAEYQKLQSQYYSEKAEHKQLTETNKKTLIKLKHLEDELAISQEHKNYWEQRAKQSEEDLKLAREQNETSDNVETFQESIEHRNEIIQLESQVALLLKNDKNLLVERIKELEEKLKVAVAVQDKKTQELEATNKQYEELKIQYKKTEQQLQLIHPEISRLQEENIRMKNENDTLSKLVSNAKGIASRFEEMKKNYVKTINDNKMMKGKIAEITTQITEIEKKAKEKMNASLEQEKNIMRLNEKISILQKDREESEKLINDLFLKINNVVS